ncbi:hypothetical protein RJ639_018685 [Escallonia herrerae]|uniref:Galactose oxidase n=1 Tax=Escallonia herrerae TaxID=1293975 RepID=A0AA89AII6_9ASTE|nr:hypothetical protein RJ639_018685 [Escallonia herrerae]
MAVLFKALLLLPLLFIVVSAKRSFKDLEEPLGGGSETINGGGVEVNVGFRDKNDDGTENINFGVGNEDNGDSDSDAKKHKHKKGENPFSWIFRGNPEKGDYDSETDGSGNEGKEPGFPYEEPKNEESGETEKPDFETDYLGLWKIDSENAGVSAMQLQLMPNNKAIWFDSTALGDSAIQLNPPGTCPVNFEKNYPDCFAHAIEYDVESGIIRTLKMESDPWCSSGGLTATGDLINTGGFNKGIRGVRVLSPCENCEWRENPTALSADRWYASQQILDDGTIAVVGGRRAYNYEIVPPDSLKFPIQQFGLRFLQETTDEVENNLYPFVYLTPDGNLFIFANNRAILVEPKTGKTIREFPNLPGGSRNYPASGMSALFPIKLSPENTDPIEAEVIVCGGNQPEAFKEVDGKPMEEKNFLPALQDCARISITKEDAEWEKEDMPTPRIMGDMLHLPTGDLLILNGAKKGTSGWWNGDEPNLTPVLYSPNKKNGERFKELKPTQIPRMYHSTAAVLPDGQVLVAGSNENDKYNFAARFPTELRVEKFAPPYLDPALDKHRPKILEDTSDKKLTYGEKFKVSFKLDNAPELGVSDIKLTMLAPPFTTHGYSQNQRMLVLGVTEVTDQLVTAVAPPSGKIAPPGHYIVYVVHRGVPSPGMWVQIA